MLIEFKIYGTDRSIHVNPRQIIAVDPPIMEDDESQASLYATVELSNGRTFRIAGSASQLASQINRLSN